MIGRRQIKVHFAVSSPLQRNIPLALALDYGPDPGTYAVVWRKFLVGTEIIPGRFFIEDCGGKFEHDLSQKVVRFEPDVIPNGYLQHPQLKISSSNAAINERLIPSRVVRVRYCLRPPFRLFSPVRQQEQLCVRISRLSVNPRCKFSSTN